MFAEVVDQVIAFYGGPKGAQERFRYKDPMAVYNWKSRGLPVRLLGEIVEDTGIPLRELKRGVRVKNA